MGIGIDYYFAGTTHLQCLNLIRDLNGNVLRSYVNDKKELDMWYEYKKNGWKGRLFVDSGAYSVHKRGAEVNVDEYIEYLNEHEQYLDLYIQLDHIPGVWGQPRTPEMTLESCNKSWDNYQYMYQRLKSPKKLCPVYHMGEALSALDRIVDSPYEFECICISCSKDIQFNQHFEWYVTCIDRIRNKRPNVKIHLLGVGKPKLKEHIDMTSMDSTSWIMTGINGSIMTPYGIYLVSEKQSNNPEYVFNKTSEEIKVLDDYCSSLGYSLEKASQDYKERISLNIEYLFRLSHEVEYSQKIRIKRRTLFG